MLITLALRSMMRVNKWTCPLCRFRFEDCRGLASVHVGRCQQPDAPVPVLLVVPVKEPAAEVEAVV
ncbi:MAG: hypothetical protein WCR23_09955, partial [Planctomycetota bacterium]